jgi:inorganic pyrophosphatase
VVGQTVIVDIDSSRGSFIKRRDDGTIDFISPLPTPYNYGSVPGTVAGDGDRLDAIVLGAALERGARVELPVRAVVCFIDEGVDDRKLVCSDRKLRASDRWGLIAFFTVYSRAKTVLNGVRGRTGRTAFLGIIDS